MKVLKCLLFSILIYVGLTLNETKAYTNVYTSESECPIYFNNLGEIDYKRDSVYTIELYFNADKYTHIVNGGNVKVKVNINGDMRYYKTGNLSQISAKYDCTFMSEDNKNYGDITIKPSITVYGTKSKADLEKKLRELAINKLIKTVERL